MVLVEELELIEEEEDVVLLKIETKGGGDNLMPVYKCPNGKYRIGSGKCMYDSKAKADSAYKAYLAKKDSKHEQKIVYSNIDGMIDSIDKEISELYEMSSVLYSIRTVVEYFRKRGTK